MKESAKLKQSVIDNTALDAKDYVRLPLAVCRKILSLRKMVRRYLSAGIPWMQVKKVILGQGVMDLESSLRVVEMFKKTDDLTAGWAYGWGSDMILIAKMRVDIAKSADETSKIAKIKKMFDFVSTGSFQKAAWTEDRSYLAAYDDLRMAEAEDEEAKKEWAATRQFAADIRSDPYAPGQYWAHMVEDVSRVWDVETAIRDYAHVINGANLKSADAALTVLRNAENNKIFGRSTVKNCR